jgi:hypothetical protein
VAIVSSTTHIEAVEDSKLSFLAGVVILSSILGASPESYEVCADLTGHHFHWACSLMGPNADEPLTVNSMLDCGAHVVLIEEGLVNTLGLCSFFLHKPETVLLAI